MSRPLFVWRLILALGGHMYSRICVLFLIGVLMLGALPAAAAGGETLIRVVLKDRAQIEQLTRLVSIDNVRGLEVTAGASPKQLARLVKEGFSFDVIEGTKQPDATTCAAGWVDDSSRIYDCYPTYAQYTALMQRFATDNPTLIRLESIGASTNTTRPHQLWVVKISDNPDSQEDEPEIFYTSTMHGDETAGFPMMLRLIDELQAGYGTDSEITALIDNNEIWINPDANPDGTYFGSDTDVGGAIRYHTTSSGANSYIDPNRNFPDPRSGPHPDGEAYSAETQLMMEFADAHSFVLSTNFHGGAEVVNYPWDTWDRLSVDNDWYVNISLKYASQAQSDAASAGNNSYLTSVNANGITNGAAWYIIDGGRQDYMTYWKGCREVTIELSSTKLLPASQLVAHWNYNRQALLDFAKQTTEGIRGVVTDLATGLPVAATIELVGYDSVIDNSYVYTDPDVGDYHRMVLPGTYTVRFTASGYAAQQVSGVTVSAGTATIVNAQLELPVMAPVSGEVTTPTTRSFLNGATVEILSAGLTNTTGAAGTYTFSAVETGDYTFKVSADGYETIEVDRSVVASGNVFNFALAPQNAAMETDLEDDDGGLGGNGSWAWGTPSGIPAPITKVWATNLSGEYSDSANDYLDLNSIAVPAISPELRFSHYYDIEDGTSDYDGGNLKIRAAGSGSYQIISPVGGYPSSNIDALGEPGFTGTLSGWEEVIVDLSSWAGQNIDLRWHFGSDSSVTQLGWYVDDIIVTGPVAHTADFEFTPANPTPGQEVHFTDRTTGAVTAWSWSFGDSNTSTAQNPGHSFQTAGSYQVTLSATLPEGVLEKTVTVVVGNGEIFADDFETGNMGSWSAATP